MANKQIALYITITVLLIYCTPNKSTTIPPTDTTVNKGVLAASLTTSTLSNTVKLTSTMNTQVAAMIAADRAAQAKDITALSNKIITANLDNAERDKKITSQALLILSLQTTLKAAQDTLNSYKKGADGAIFKTVNGVLTLPYFLEIKDYLIKIGAIKP